ncbi:MAG: hypothetical protein ACOCXJ_01455 [Planctomycetota bacterium]
MLAEEFQEQLNRPVDVAELTSGQTSGMTLRERWRRCMFFQHCDTLPNFEFGYWDQTLANWRDQGLPAHITNEREAYAYFGIESGQGAPIDVMGLRPGFPHEVLEETEQHIVYRGGEGEVAKINRHGDRSIPHYLSFPIEDRSDWEAFKERLQPNPERIPANWPELAAAYRRRDTPLSVPIGSMIGKARNWIGFEGIALMIYDDPNLLEEIVETCCQLVCDTLEPILKDVEFDLGFGWEDICFNSGPIVGVDFMRDIVVPRYRRIRDLLRKHGVPICTTDCDGNITPIVDCFLDGGINCMFPVEVHGGSDPVALRQRWPDLRLAGGVDKMKLLEGPDAIRAELERLLPLVCDGGFIPHVDHRVQADVTLQNYQYYLKMKRALFGVGGEPRYDESAIG